MATLYMATTRISATKTSSEIIKYLAAAGARRVMQEFADGETAKLSFELIVGDRPVPFHLPIRVEPVFEFLQRQRAVRNRERMADVDREQAERIAWRQVLRWIQAQFALIETGMVSAGEVFLPYVAMTPEHTLFEQMASSNFKALPMLEPIDG